VTKRSVSTHTALAAALAFTLLAILVQLGLTTPYDEAGLRGVLAIRRPALTSVMLAFTTVGGGLIALPFALACAAWFRAFRGGRTAGFYIVACLTGWGMHALLKLVFGRARPTLIPRLHGAGWVSFPSGHAMTSTVIYGLAILLATERSRGTVGSRALVAAGCLLIAGISFSRVYLGVHYPSDVVAGMLGGWAWIGVMLAWLRPRMERVP
jgi:undecaprenyl-diphosphatase